MLTTTMIVDNLSTLLISVKLSSGAATPFHHSYHLTIALLHPIGPQSALTTPNPQCLSTMSNNKHTSMIPPTIPITNL